MATYFVTNSIIMGSAKVQNFEHAIEALDISQFTISNNPSPSRTEDRKQGTQPRFGSLYWIAPVSGDTVLALSSLAKGDNVKELSVTRVQFDGQSNVAELTIEFGKLNGATHVTAWSLSYDPLKSPHNSGLWYAAQIQTDGVNVTSNMVGQDQSAKGQVAGAFSALNQTKS